MTLTPDQRKRLLGHRGLTRIAKATKRTLGHVSQVNSEKRADVVVMRHITKGIVAKNPDISPEQVWPLSA